MNSDPAGRHDDVMRTEMSRRRVLRGMLATAGVVAVGAGIDGWAAQGPARAAGAILPPGTRPNPSLPEGVDTLPEIEHIIIYMQENHSYDQYFGMLGRGDGFTLGPDGLPTNANPDANGNPVRAFYAGPTCDTNIGGDHSWNAEHLAVNGGTMDGFIRGNGGDPRIMGYYDDRNLPFYWGLAKTFPICDRWFCSVRGPTHPNRRFLQAGTSAGIVQTSVPEVLATPNAPNGTIWDRLDDHRISWKNYMFDLGDIYLFPGSDIAKFNARTADNRRTFSDFLLDCQKGTLPAVSILAPALSGWYDEGARDVQNGEAYSAAIINAVMSSPSWSKSIVLFTYDENGGGYDHVAPPPAVAPDNIAPRIDAGDQPGDFTNLGPRVPGFVISPFSKANYVSHVVHDHTSILRFIETKYNLGAITHRDANASDLLDSLDFANPGFLDPPDLPAPGLPATGSVCEPQPYPAFNPKDVTTTSTTTPTVTTTTAPTGSEGTRGSTTLPASLNSLMDAPPAQPVRGDANFTG
ncbi:MAG TPA: alkaline phosphatase family protein [Acidimicrobiales bacterium]|nr:alkaline phosphatase family protein [Acidimicrobiales bacterium]